MVTARLILRLLSPHRLHRVIRPLHRQQAIHSEAGSIMDKINKIAGLTIEDNLSMEARVILQNLASEFVESCFNRRL